MAHSPPTDLNRRLFALYIGTKSKNRKKQSHRHQFASSPTAFDVSVVVGCRSDCASFVWCVW